MSDQQAFTSTLTADELWQFSLDYYALPGIKEACLTLQNRYQGNVNLLLVLKWLGEHKLAIADNDWHPLHSAIQNTENLLQPYRELRRQLKTQVSDNLYRKALQFELQLEQQQQQNLVAQLQSQPLVQGTAHSMLSSYCHALGADELTAIFTQ